MHPADLCRSTLVLQAMSELGVSESTFSSFVFPSLAEATPGHKASQGRPMYQAARKILEHTFSLSVTESWADKRGNGPNKDLQKVQGQVPVPRREIDLPFSSSPS
jgi:hypothetical protein